jgi:hypothetical protein
MEFKFLDKLSDESIIKFFKDKLNIRNLLSKLQQYEFKDYKIFIYVPSISINSSGSIQKYLWVSCDNNSNTNYNQDIMIDFYNTNT